MKKNLLLFILSLGVATIAMAQDPHFSQFYAASNQINPATIGVFNGKWRAAVNYRDQWGSILNDVPFRTIGASADMRVPVGRNDAMGVGFVVLHDEAGAGRFTQNKAQLGGSFMKQMGGGGRHRRGAADQFLIAGAQAGVGQFTNNYNNLWFSQQFNKATESIDKNLSSGENNLVNASNIFLDANAGLMYYSVWDDSKSFYGGASLSHLNRPNISMSNTPSSIETLAWRWTAHVGGELPLTDQLSLLPAALVMKQRTSLQINTGANIRYTNHDRNEVALRFGVWNRISNRLDKGLNIDAIICTAVLETERVHVGLSYDINTSRLVPATNSRGAFELSLIYIQPEGRRRASVSCPKF
jgi:type IX secretion system PorP/SprF family membrane protein